MNTSPCKQLAYLQAADAVCTTACVVVEAMAVLRAQSLVSVIWRCTWARSLTRYSQV